MNDQHQVKSLPPVWVFSVISGLRNFFKKMYYGFVPPALAVFEKTQGIWIAKAIGVACELNLAEIVAADEKTVEYIATQSNTDAGALYRLMRALASEGIFTETRPGVFKNNKYSNALRQGPGNLKHMIMHQMSETNWEVLNGLKYSVSSGNNNMEKILGHDVFTYLGITPEKNALYNKAMSETSRLSSAAIVSAYAFKGINTLADIGGGEGALLFTILKKHPALKGVLFDFSHVVETALTQAKNTGVEDRVTIVAGSFFTDPLPEADAYLLKNILHAFDDETCIRILKSVGTAMQGKGKIMVIETVIRNNNKPAFGKLFDLQMLIGTPQGRERTAKEFNTIFEASGFSLHKVIKTISPFCIVEGIKN